LPIASVRAVQIPDLTSATCLFSKRYT